MAFRGRDGQYNASVFDLIFASVLLGVAPAQDKLTMAGSGFRRYQWMISYDFAYAYADTLVKSTKKLGLGLVGNIPEGSLYTR